MEHEQDEACGPVQRNTVLAMADAIKVAFPDLGGRVVPVSVTEPDRQTMPALPLAVIAFDDGDFEGSARTNRDPYVVEKICLEFWLEPAKYPLGDGRPSALWAFYDYQTQVDAVLAFASDWTTPWNQKLNPVGVKQSTDDFAVYLSFFFTHRYQWRAPRRDPGSPFRIAQRVSAWVKPCCTCTPIVTDCPTCQTPIWRP